MRLVVGAWAAVGAIGFVACGETLGGDAPVSAVDGGSDVSVDAVDRADGDAVEASADGAVGDAGCFHARDAGPLIFTDVDASSAEIAALAEAGIIDTCGGTQFCPDQLARRREAIRWAVRIAVGEAFGYGCVPYFNDVPTGDPDFAYVQKAKEVGLTGGIGNGSFGTDIQVGRSGVAVFASITAGLDLNDAGVDAQSFDDVPYAPNNRVFAGIELAFRNGFMGACEDDAGTDSGLPRFCPDAAVERGDVATAYARARALRGQ